MQLAKTSITSILIAAALAIASLFVFNLTAPAAVNAQDTTNACAGVTLAGGTCDATGEANIGSVIRVVINILSIIVGAISVIMIVIGGLRYVVSAGDSSATAGAKNTIIYAIVGLIIVILAQAIVAFVLNRVQTGDAGGGDATGDTPGTGLVLPSDQILG